MLLSPADLTSLFFFDHSPLSQAMPVRLYLLSTGQTLLENIPEMFSGCPFYVRGNEINNHFCRLKQQYATALFRKVHYSTQLYFPGKTWHGSMIHIASLWCIICYVTMTMSSTWPMAVPRVPRGRKREGPGNEVAPIVSRVCWRGPSLFSGGTITWLTNIVSACHIVLKWPIRAWEKSHAHALVWYILKWFTIWCYLRYQFVMLWYDYFGCGLIKVVRKQTARI